MPTPWQLQLIILSGNAPIATSFSIDVISIDAFNQEKADSLQ